MSAIAAAAILGGASLLGSALNTMSQQDANDVAQSQFKQNMALQKWQYADSKRYNSPSNQVRNIRYGGMNPALMMGSGYSPTPVTPTSGVSPTSEYKPVDYAGIINSAGNVANTIVNANLANTQSVKNMADAHQAEIETAGKQIDNIYKDEFWKSSNYVRNSLAWLQDKQAENAKLEVEYNRASLGDRLFEARWNSEYKRALAEAQLITNSYIPQQLQAQVGDLVASAKQRIMMGTASLKQAMASIMQSQATKNAFDAQYGGNPAQRGQFFNATLRSLEQSAKTAKSQEFRNWFEPSVNLHGFSFHTPVGARNAGRVANSAY